MFEETLDSFLHLRETGIIYVRRIRQGGFSGLSGLLQNFNVQGQAFGPKELEECIRHGVIHILDDATIETMKERYAERKLRDEALQQAEAVADGEVVDWEEVQRQWNEYYGIEN